MRFRFDRTSVAAWSATLAVLLATAAPARADKLILIPTADVEGFRGEFMSGSEAVGGVTTAQLGLGRYFEVMGRRYQFRLDEQTEVGGQLQVLPEGFVTPGLALGVWDVGNETRRGRRMFGVLSKRIPGVHFIPTVFRSLRLHMGAGTGRLSTLFMGAHVGLPWGFSLAMEGTGSDFNAGLWWSPARIVRIKAETWDGEFFFGAQVNAPL
jgi:hypothetical protein